jgi:broad specificity phosphatase PhoE
LFARAYRNAASLQYIASPLGRACQTMELVRETLNLPRGGYATDPRLREIGYGGWEGLTLMQARQRDGELFERRLADKWIVAPPDGENYISVQARVSDWYHQLAADTVAVAHGGTARALMVALGFETAESAADLIVEQGAVYMFGDGVLTKYG